MNKEKENISIKEACKGPKLKKLVELGIEDAIPTNLGFTTRLRG